ncbi:MAG: HAD-IIIC family phosphatase [Butyrivibrio sp.]|nr:HAD-IIIC family phosphatase [Acetatifactor muris]MCM1559374.1 HAD-IIIC family phosphatase [Butyrivibrio sp.]
MYSFIELKNGLKNNIDKPPVKLVILGNVATQLLATAIEGNAKLEGINLEVFDADYNQTAFQLMDTQSETYAFQPNFILLYEAADKLYEEFLDEDGTGRRNFADRVMERIVGFWGMVSQNTNAKILQCNFTEICDRAFGSYSCKTDVSFTFQIRKLNFLLQQAMAGHSFVYPVDLLSLQLQMGTDKWHNSALYYDTKLTCDMNALPYFSKCVVDVLKAMNGRVKKCVALDLDNTLWGGVIGDDGIGGIEIGELGKGHAYANLQRWLKQLKERGVLLAVCSKNDEDKAKEPFEKHEEMILKLSDISMFVANWNDKAANIRLIQESLNIGMDSMVFIDDNAFERNLVRELIPEITVPELPEDPADYLDFLQAENLFETVSYSDEDRGRTKQYQAEFKRKDMQSMVASFEDYLKSLNMTGGMKEFEPDKFARIAQLTQRSNQFNLRTVRYTEDDIKRISEDDNYITAYCTLKDKFGDYGLVSVLILEKRPDGEAFVDTWLMSCRVLKRSMEEFIINSLVGLVKKSGLTRIMGEYIQTAKNSMVSDIYPRMGFEPLGNGRYSLEINGFKTLQTYVGGSENEQG